VTVLPVTGAGDVVLAFSGAPAGGVVDDVVAGDVLCGVEPGAGVAGPGVAVPVELPPLLGLSLVLHANAQSNPITAAICRCRRMLLDSGKLHAQYSHVESDSVWEMPIRRPSSQGWNVCHG
jgi:hypothetical protein